MDEIAQTKGAIAVTAGVIAYLTDRINVITVVLVFLMIFDYVTGVIAAWIKKEISSQKSIVGVIKKLAYLMIVVMGCFFDLVAMYMAQGIGLNFSTGGAVGVAVICWLIGTESISIIENLGVIGVPVPPFLTGGFERLKNLSEEVGKDENRT